MDLDLLILEVDGSLANPYAAGAVAIWTAFLSGIAVVLVRRLTRSGSSRPAWALLFVVALQVTKPAQLFIGNVLYRIVDLHITDVGVKQAAQSPFGRSGFPGQVKRRTDSQYQRSGSGGQVNLGGLSPEQFEATHKPRRPSFH